MTDRPEKAAGRPAVRELAPAESGSWDEELAKRPEATLYQSSAWSALVEEVFGHRTTRLVCERDGRPCGLLPLVRVRMPLLGRKALSLPFDVASGGPLAEDEESAAALLRAAAAHARAFGAGYLELRCREPLPAAVELGFRESTPLVVTEMELADPDSAWSAVSKHHQRSVKTAAKRGVELRLAASEEDVASFYRVYLETFRAFGTPPYPRRYFEAVRERLFGRGAYLLVASAEGRDVGGMLLFGLGRTLLMKFGVCLEEAVGLRVYAALYWRAIQLALENGHARLSWGSSAPAQSGLIEFKERWGARTRPVHFYDLALKRDAPDIAKYYDSEGLSRRVWKRLPLAVTALLGGPLNRWFC